MTARYFLLPLLLVTPLSGLHAQALRGRLIQADGQVPVVGALVVLEDSLGARAGQAVSGAEGRVIVRAPSAGSYLLRVLRIGYAPFETPIALDAGQYLDRTLILEGAPVALPEIAIAGKSVCGNLSRGDTLSTALWTQARTALAITAQTITSRSLRFRTALEGRNIDRLGNPSRLEVLNSVGTSSWPVRSPPPDTLLASGFIENLEDTDTGPTWYGPDAEFLLSDPFFAGHCFHTVPPTGAISPGWVGLAFEPATHDRRADIQGTLWMDRQSAELRRLDFSYTRLPRWAHGFEGGGQLFFASLPGGGWVVQRWQLRVPLPQRIAPGTMRVYGYRESGGHVTAVLDSQGKILQSFRN